MPHQPKPLTDHAAARQNSAGRWTLLLVADDGRLRQAPHFKAILTAGTVALVLALAGALVSVMLATHYRRQHADVSARLEKTEQSLTAARDHYQLLLAQAAIAGQKAPAHTQGDGQPVGDSGTAQPGSEPPAIANPVDADDLKFLHKKGSRHFQVHFKLKNNIETGPASGYAFLVLHPHFLPEGKDPMVMPDVPFERQRPTDYKRGRPFTMTRFTAVRFDGRDPDPARFAIAQVLVFDKNGTVMLDRRLDASTGTAME